ncbi:hypothetical protein DAPPUDRAFT_304179 [Daphnia pulex]|uniref:Uncharacterized protein n=1 Tax=Daphnia pulex TaxID=6669 RepID=E9GJT3_DAPPU|nr:hypothetical protein DAPPUDRAFT_304179 [Daphnia pulex]|eukprot:EFX80166.1 hypothetical protein DAPPUDRAFT_304179 [Daphnia pulex]
MKMEYPWNGIILICNRPTTTHRKSPMMMRNRRYLRIQYFQPLAQRFPCTKVASCWKFKTLILFGARKNLATWSGREQHLAVMHRPPLHRLRSSHLFKRRGRVIP